jgi:TetR/AcrR family transcriptional repressor of nem operon
MARYPSGHKERTRARIVGAASRRFRRTGGHASGIGPLMRELKLTHGGFYKHFESKEQLFEEALQASVTEMSDRMAGLADAAGPAAALDAIIDAYLSEGHCARPESGCPMAALGADISRLPRRSRDTCRGLLFAYAARLAQYLPGQSQEEREDLAALLFSGMAGTVALARTVTDTAARARLLADARVFYRRACRG